MDYAGQVISNMYIPLLHEKETKSIEEPRAREDIESSLKSSSHKAEISIYLQRFSTHVSHAIQQLSGDVNFNIPDIIINDVQAAAQDVEIVTLLENTIADWTQGLIKAIQKELDKIPVKKGPLGEIEYWRERNAEFSSLYEQLNVGPIQDIIQVVEIGSEDEALKQVGIILGWASMYQIAAL